MVRLGSVITVTEDLIDRIALAIALESLTEEGRKAHGWPSEEMWHPDEVRHYRELALAALNGAEASQIH